MLVVPKRLHVAQNPVQRSVLIKARANAVKLVISIRMIVLLRVKKNAPKKEAVNVTTTVE